MRVWGKAHELTILIYKATSNFPSTETFGLVSQMRRAAYSIPMNIAEGCGRGSNADFLRFLYMALGSSHEIEYQILLAKDLSYIDELLHQDLYARIGEIKAMLIALLNTIKRSSDGQKTTKR